MLHLGAPPLIYKSNKNEKKSETSLDSDKEFKRTSSNRVYSVDSGIKEVKPIIKKSSTRSVSTSSYSGKNFLMRQLTQEVVDLKQTPLNTTLKTNEIVPNFLKKYESENEFNESQEKENLTTKDSRKNSNEKKHSSWKFFSSRWNRSNRNSNTSPSKAAQVVQPEITETTITDAEFMVYKYGHKEINYTPEEIEYFKEKNKRNSSTSSEERTSSFSRFFSSDSSTRSRSTNRLFSTSIFDFNSNFNSKSSFSSTTSSASSTSSTSTSSASTKYKKHTMLYVDYIFGIDALSHPSEIELKSFNRNLSRNNSLRGDSERGSFTRTLTGGSKCSEEEFCLHNINNLIREDNLNILMNSPLNSPILSRQTTSNSIHLSLQDDTVPHPSIRNSFNLSLFNPYEVEDNQSTSNSPIITDPSNCVSSNPSHVNSSPLLDATLGCISIDGPQRLLIRAYFMTYWTKFINKLDQVMPSIKYHNEELYELIRTQPFSSGAYLRGVLLSGFSCTCFQLINLLSWYNIKNLSLNNSAVETVASAVTSDAISSSILHFSYLKSISTILTCLLFLNILQLPTRIHIHYLCWESSRAIEVDKAIYLIRTLLLSDSWFLNKFIGRISDILLVILLGLCEAYLWNSSFSSSFHFVSDLEREKFRNFVVSVSSTCLLAVVSRFISACFYSFSLTDPSTLSEARKRGLSKIDISRLPVLKYKKSTELDVKIENINPTKFNRVISSFSSIFSSTSCHVSTSYNSVNCQDCSICLEGFVEHENVTNLPCDLKHCFHTECIKKWLEKQNSCPLCQRLV